jgi:hypothetical protein
MEEELHFCLPDRSSGRGTFMSAHLIVLLEEGLHLYPTDHSVEKELHLYAHDHSLGSGTLSMLT